MAYDWAYAGGPAGLALLLAGTIALELAHESADHGSMIDKAVSLESPDPAAVPTPVRPHNWQALVASTLARPLFAASRRPAVQLASPVATERPPRLTGILVYGERRSAIFAAPDGRHPMIAYESTQVGAYTVQSIETRQVTLSGPKGTQILRPSFDLQSQNHDVSATVGGLAPFANVADIVQSLQRLPGFSGTPR